MKIPGLLVGRARLHVAFERERERRRSNRVALFFFSLGLYRAGCRGEFFEVALESCRLRKLADGDYCWIVMVEFIYLVGSDGKNFLGEALV